MAARGAAPEHFRAGTKATLGAKAPCEGLVSRPSPILEAMADSAFEPNGSRLSPLGNRARRQFMGLTAVQPIVLSMPSRVTRELATCPQWFQPPAERVRARVTKVFSTGWRRSYLRNVLNSQGASMVTRKRLINDLQALGRDLGRTPTKTDVDQGSKERLCRSAPRYVKEFGSIVRAQIAAGFEPHRERRTRKRMIADLRALARKLGRTPSERDVSKGPSQRSCSSTTRYITVFGSIREAQIAAGFNPHHLTRDRDKLIADLQELGRKLGRTPTTRDITLGSRRRFCRLPNIYASEFGSITKAQAAAGFEPNIMNRTREQMVADLQELGRKLGRTPTSADIARGSKERLCQSRNTYARVFGSVIEAQIAARFEPRLKKPIRKRKSTETP